MKWNYVGGFIEILIPHSLIPDPRSYPKGEIKEVILQVRLQISETLMLT